MADLDNFFAKKGKKKVKGRKYDNPDDIAKRLKESEKKLEKELCKVEPVKKTLGLDEVLSTANSGSDAVVPETKIEKDEEEWKDFIYDSQKDLTNLKVSKLQIEDEDDGGMGYGSGEDEGGSGGGMRSDGVWNKNIDRLESEQNMADAEIVVPSMTKEDSPSSGNLKSSYVPPHLRNMAASPLPKAGNRKPKTAPDITSSMAFPSLSDSQTATPAGAWGKKKVGDDRGFESVKHGSTKNYSEDYAPPKLSTANRFDALSDSS